MAEIYQTIIAQIADDVNPAGVEAHMRAEYGTLGHLDRAAFVREVKIARKCERASPGYLRKVADSYGMAYEFDRWEERHP